jgi:hypothetical protein
VGRPETRYRFPPVKQVLTFQLKYFLHFLRIP